ncbi:MAG: molybdopterin-dependent oxidoreductase [Deltaproteobacteria bacterium]|nr:molybdopterin-dependent oxidoreductase [Deltaproteobacteria bacterium]
MKIDRRAFLSLGIGAAAGSALTPMPWKITDDLSIWSQNWPWTPIPKDGAVTYSESVCGLCPGGCGIMVRKVDNRAVKIEGVKGHPVNNGSICILGLSGLQLLYGPTRIKQPMKRAGKRGEGKWQPISWQQAIDEISANLKTLRKNGDSHTVAGVMESDRGTVPRLMERFLSAFGSPNFFRMPSIQDTYELTLYLMQGVRASAGFDLANSDFVISFGSGLIEGWGSPVHMFQANSRRREAGAKLVQVEPRLSNTAAKADQWIPILPGTEAALALGLAHVIIREGHRRDFVTRHSFGFEDWVDSEGQTHKGFKRFVLDNYSPAQTEKFTGVAKKKVIALARDFANAGKPLAVGGRGIGRIPGNLHEMMAIHSLNALVGSINRTGGVTAVPEPDYIQWPDVEMDRVAVKGIQKGRIDGAGSPDKPHSRYLIHQLAAAVIDGAPYPIKALFVSGANPAYSLPNASGFREAMAKIPFVVSFSSYLDETSQLSDLLLPNHMYLERYEDVPGPVGFPERLIGLSRPALPPQFNTRHVADVILELAKRMDAPVADAFPWSDYESCLRETLADKWQPLLRAGFLAESSTMDRAAPFDTSSGKFEFSASLLRNGRKADEAALPHYEPFVPEGDAGAYPLLLVPYDTMRLSSGYAGSTPFMIKTVSDDVLKHDMGYVEMNPKTARDSNLTEGQAALLSTPLGKARVKVHLFEGIRPGIVAVPRGLGHTAYDDYLARKGININELIGPVVDPVSGLDQAWGIRAKLIKA